jgi:metal-responsive CopG/Arc/MetJ family transcriptional regulator
VELLEKVDELLEVLGLLSREAFVEAAVRRLIDHYLILAPSKKEKLGKR